jgi:hypothetical protein
LFKRYALSEIEKYSLKQLRKFCIIESDEKKEKKESLKKRPKNLK